MTNKEKYLDLMEQLEWNKKQLRNYKFYLDGGVKQAKYGYEDYKQDVKENLKQLKQLKYLVY